MHNIDVSFWSNSKIMLASLSLPGTETVGGLKEKLANKISVFTSREIVIVEQKAKGSYEILPDAKKFSEYQEKSVVSLRAFPRISSILFKTADIYEQHDVDVTMDVFHIIYDIIAEKPQRYAVGYSSQDESGDGATFNCCSLSLPLCVQGWFHSTLFLIRRLYADDISGEIDEKAANFFVENCRIANNYSLSAYSLDVWGKLAAYQFLSEKIPRITEAYIRQNITRSIAQSVISEAKNDLVEKTIFFVRKHAKLDSDAALKQYLETTVNEGCQCSHFEKIKFKVMGTHWFSQQRYLYICPDKIWITKEVAFMPTEMAKTSEILSVTFNQKKVIIEFISHAKWFIKSRRPEVLISLINEIIKNPYKSLPDRASIQLEQNLQTKPIAGVLSDNEKSLAVVAPVTKRKNSKDDDSNDDFSEVLFPARTSIGQVSSFSLEPDLEPLPGQKISKRVTSLRKPPKCIPDVILPKASDPDVQVDFFHQFQKVIQLTKPADETSSIIEEENLIPSVEEFFEYRENEDLTNNKSVLLCILISFFLLRIIRKIYSFF